MRTSGSRVVSTAGVSAAARDAGGWSAAPSARRPPGGCRRAAAACPARLRSGSAGRPTRAAESSCPCRALRRRAAVRPRGRGPIGPPPPTPAPAPRRAEAARAGARSRRRRPPVRARHDSTTYPRHFPAAVRGTIAGWTTQRSNGCAPWSGRSHPARSAATARSPTRRGCSSARLVGRRARRRRPRPALAPGRAGERHLRPAHRRGAGRAAAGRGCPGPRTAGSRPSSAPAGADRGLALPNVPTRAPNVPTRAAERADSSCGRACWTGCSRVRRCGAGCGAVAGDDRGDDVRVGTQRRGHDVRSGLGQARVEDHPARAATTPS